MRILRFLFLSALGLVAGCGGCDSCFGKASPEDDAASAVTTPPPPLPRPMIFDAAPKPIEDAGVEDAAKDSAPEPPAIPMASGLPRPKAPMAMGAFQACGVYDGPLCQKSCDTGNCRQECDGVDCVLTCKGGYCSQLCGADAKCRLFCPGGHCVQVCTNAEGCVKDCPANDCE